MKTRFSEWHIPYLTHNLKGIGGRLRDVLDDFVVEEIPAYDPIGYGEHVFFRVEKRGISTMNLIKEIAQKLNVPVNTISSAGLKDKNAITRQTLSAHNVTSEAIETLSLACADILWVSRHTNKLRTGHLKANRFAIRIRGVGPDAETHAAPILNLLEQRGVPNAYGEQRFGNRGDNHQIGELILRNDRESLVLHGIRQPSYRMKNFFISAFQSSLFNQYLAMRIKHGSMDTVIKGDIARKEDTGGLFVVEDTVIDSKRVRAWDISPTGPIYGYKMMQATELAGELETSLLTKNNLTLQSFRAVKSKGSRRPLRYKPENLAWYHDGEDALVITFTAPKGSFATILLDELMKT